MTAHRPDAVVVGSGPNGLAAAITLARAGLAVTVYEQASTIGGGTRTEELTLPGFRHDVCSAVHPLAAASPFFQTLPLQEHGLEWIYPEIQLAHPLPGGSATVVYRSIEKTARSMGQHGVGYERLMAPLVHRWPDLANDLLAPLHFPQHPLQMAGFGIIGLLSAKTLSHMVLKGRSASALFAGLAAHSFLPLDSPLTGAFGLILGTLAHVAGWPLAKGGSAAITNAMASYFLSLGGEIKVSTPITSLGELPAVKVAMLDITPRQLLGICGHHSLKAGYRRVIEHYRYGPGVFKIDWALSGPIPWEAGGCRQAGTVHLGGTADDLAKAEDEVWQGVHSRQPFVLLVQPTLFDPSRAPEGMHVGWAYCHVPNGSTVDMTEAIENQVELYAPGFKKMILARHTMTCQGYERYNPNYIGGDINGGVQDVKQFLKRPKLFSPYRTPLRGVYICSSSTPPGGGVHGMCGFHAASAALKDLKRRS